MVNINGREAFAFNGAKLRIMKHLSQGRQKQIVFADSGHYSNLFDSNDHFQIEVLVSAAGLEPATHALKGHCSTN